MNRGNALFGFCRYCFYYFFLNKLRRSLKNMMSRFITSLRVSCVVIKIEFELLLLILLLIIVL